MKMTREEKLKRIVEICEEHLEIAKKRTPGRFESLGITQSNCLRLFAGNEYLGVVGSSDAETSKIQANADFVIACAGPAEAGWKATIASCKRILKCVRITATDVEEGDEIIDAWEGLL